MLNAVTSTLRPAWTARGQLPRESRDTLFLLAVIAWILAPQTGHVPLWCSLMGAAVLVWRAWLAWTGGPLPATRWRMGLLALAMGATVWQFGTLLGRDSGVTLIVILLSLKTLELRARRDAFVVFFLGFFMMLTHFFYSQSLLTAAGILVGLLGLLTALVNAHLPVGRPPLLQSLRTAGFMALLGAPVMLALFVLFPRMAPLWGIPADQASGRSGLSGTMQVGSVASLALSDEIAFRVRFQGPAPSPREMYWRGPVLSGFDGREWRSLRPEQLPWFPPPVNLRVSGEPVRYQVTVQPNNRPWMFTLDGTPNAPRRGDDARVFMNHELQWLSSRPLTDVTRYDVESYLNFAHGPVSPMRELQSYVELPPGFNPRTLQLAADLRATPELAQADALTLSAAVLNRLRTGGYVYTLEPGVYGPNAADEFWFDRKTGFCEHIASAFVILMRAMDVPARVVTGYQGGEINSVDGFWVIRQRDAHAWAEIWQAGRGWVRVDPTTAVFPGRVGELVQRLQAPPGLVANALATVDPNLLATLRANWEALNNRWNQWVLNYTQSRQLDLLRSLGFDAPDWQDLAALLMGLVIAVSLAGAAWAWWEKSRIDPWLRLLKDAQDRLARLGLDLPAHAPPRALAQAAREHFGASAEPLATWLLQLERLRYAQPDASGQGLGELRRQWRQMSFPRNADRSAASSAASSAAGSALGSTVRSTILLCVMGLAVALALAGAGLPSQAWAAAPDAAPAVRPAKPHTPGQTAPRPQARSPKPAAAPASAGPGPVYGGRPDVMQAADDIAERRGLDREWVRAVMGSARLQPQAIRLVLPAQRGTAKNWTAYRARFIEPRRIAAGARFWRQHEAALLRAEQQYGVPPWLVVGVVGVETLYGQHMGRHRVLDALVTLAFDFPSAHPRAAERQAFFRQELEQFLSLKNRSGMDPSGFLGSYAGAMGLPQFMPSSWVRYAVDFDSDGRIDLFGSPVDAIGSVASYFQGFQWRPGLRTHYPVTLTASPAQLEQLLAPDILPTFSARRLSELGATPGDGGEQHTGLLALVELENGDAPPSFVAGTENFYAVTRYNWSSYYAMAVIELGQAVEAAVRTSATPAP